MRKDGEKGVLLRMVGLVLRGTRNNDAVDGTNRAPMEQKVGKHMSLHHFSYLASPLK